MKEKKEKPKFPKCHRRAKTPTVLQMEALECGAASLCMILGHFKKFVPLELLRIDCGVNRDGSKASNVKKAAIKHGLQCEGRRRELKSLKDVIFPAIIFWNFNHFVVLEGMKGDKAWINDPASGRRAVSYEEFNDSFTGVILEFKKGPDFKKGGRRPSMVPALMDRLWKFRTSLLFILLASLLLIIPGFVVPVFNRFFIDNILVSKMDSFIRPFLIAMGLTALINMTLNYLKEKYLLRLEMKLSMVSSAKFVTHLMKLPSEFFIQRMPGELVQRLDSNTVIANLVGEKLIGLVINVIMTLFFGILMFFYDWVLALISIALVSVNFIVLKFTSEKLKMGTFKIQMEGGKMQGLMMSGLEMIETLKSSGSENDFFQQWSGQQAKVVSENQRISALSSITNQIPGLINSILSILILSVGALRIMDGYMTIGMLMAFQTINASFTAPVTQLMALVQQVLSNSADMTRVDDVLNYPAMKRFKDDFDENSVDENKPVPKMNGNITLKDVTFGYSRLAPPLISNLNLELTPGKRIALVGGSGSGKSTIGKLVSSLYAPWSGEILFDGKPLSEIEKKTFADSVSVVDQNISLFEGTIRDNITMWNSTIPEEVYIQAAKDACIHDVIASRPDGYYAMVSESGKNFSGGQKQRLEIARALANNPRILVMDEATSALDTITEMQVDENIRRRGCTSIIIAHRLSTIRDADEIIVLEHGVIVQRGTHDELSVQDGLYKELIKTM